MSDTTDRDLAIDQGTGSGVTENERRLVRVLQGSNDGFWEWSDLARSEFWWSSRLFEMLGYRSDEFVPTYDRLIAMIHPDDREPVASRLANLSEEGPYESLYRIQHKSGCYIWFHARGTILRLADGRPFSVSGTVRDVSEQHESEERLRKSEELFRCVFQHSAIGVATTDLQGRFTRVNDAACGIFGYEPDELVGKSFSEITSTDDLVSAQENVERLLRGDVDSFTLEQRFRNRTGSTLWCNVTASTVNDGEGHPEFLVVQIQDVTARRKSEAALLRSEQKFRALFEHAGSHCMILDPNTSDGIPVILDANKAACQAHGYTREEFIGRPVADIDDEEGKRLCVERTRQMMRGEPLHIENTHVRKDGSSFPTAVDAKRIDIGNEPPLILSIEQDISRRKAVERELARVAEQYRETAEQLSTRTQIVDQAERVARVGSWEWRLESNRAFWSDTMFEIFGLLCSEPSYDDVRDLIHSDDVEWWEDRLREMLEHSSGPFDLDYRIVRPDGETAWIHDVASVIRDDAGKALKMVGMSQDVTERKKAEKALQASEAKFRSLFDLSPIAIQLYDSDGVLIDVNRRTLELFGVDDASQLLGYVMWDSPDYTPEIIEQVKAGQSVYIAGEFDFEAAKETRLFSSNRSGRLHLDMYVFPLTVAGVITGYTVQLVDVTERRTVEAQLQQAQKMESVGRLAGGIAHDFNNILVPILSCAELAMAALDESEPAYADLIRIREAASRAASLTQRILAFSRKQVLQMQVLSLNDVIDSFEEILRRLIGESITLRIRPSGKLRLVRADPGQLEQVLMNLAINSRDAMPDGGELIIETANVDADDSAPALPAAEQVSGGCVLLAVRDTGHGMDTATREQVFEPFFTTKGKEKGSGLGLSTTIGIVQQHGGVIGVDSEVGHGTTFSVYLPAVQDGASANETVDKGEVAERDVLQETETVLLVEDEELVRQVVSRTLNGRGYRVLEASRPSEAVAIASQYKESIDLLLTDVVMPEMNGTELYGQVAELSPDIKVLYMSGYTDDTIVHHGVLNEEVAFLQKPFGIRRLLQLVGEVLSRDDGTENE